MSSFQGILGSRVLQKYHKLIGQLLLALLVVGYWLYAWQLERISYEVAPPNIWSQVVTSYPLFSVAESVVLFLFEFLSPRVLRHLIPLVAGFWLARVVVVRFLESFYDLSDRSMAKSLLGRLMNLGAPNRSMGSLGHNQETVALRQNPQLRVGGPGFIHVSPGSAVLTEVNGHIAHVYGPDSHALSRFESPRAIVDLRPQERKSEEIEIVTSDGIDLTATISVTFHVDSAGQAPTRDQPFPFSSDAARQTAYAETNLSGGKIAQWDELTLEVAISELARLVTESRLDELINIEKQGIYPHPRIKSELERRVGEIIRPHGVEIREIHLGRFELPDPVVHQTIRYWQTFWKQKRRNEFEQEVPTPETVELAEQQAKARLVESIATELHRVQRQGVGIGQRREVAYRMIGELENTLLALDVDDQNQTAPLVLSRLSTLKRRLRRDKAEFSNQDDLPKLTDG
jgi:regulator of protease activity HflC (stomatin/prohibitin superfamily)